MADFDFPDDLLQLQRDFYAADRRCGEISASHPRAADIVTGVAEVTAEQRAELAAARAERLRITEQMQGHTWWETVDVAAAKAALRKATQA
ncbi:hypothetical protein [Spirillospora sp. NBC_01491]|uniref:hypothetical protein n=1 Tax=Spirillospora sp. NBC_01491 TaxID=2976007 RepID=UPI002E356955|nr:hypothetical protein [Spirillospora sp. NBC_01491]